MISQTNGINDFGLIDRTHQDESWIEKYDDKTKHLEMDSDAIVKEYKKRYVNGRGWVYTYWKANKVNLQKKKVAQVLFKIKKGQLLFPLLTKTLSKIGVFC